MKRLLVLLPLFALGACCLRAQEMSLATNLMGYANLGTMNVEASYGFARHWSVNAAVKYNPFSYDSEKYTKMQNRQQSYSIGARYWPWHIFSGWWLSAKMQYQEFNTGGIVSKETSEGDRFGSGLSGGFSYMLNSHFNIDFGLGLWAGYEKYTKYECPVCGVKIGEGDRMFVLPNEVLMSLTYVF